MKQKRMTENIFFGLAAFHILWTYVLLAWSQGSFLQQLTYGESNFCDFWSHVNRLLFCTRIYASDADAIFPPLAYLLLRIFSSPLGFHAQEGQDLHQISVSGYGILMVVLYMQIFAWLLTVAVHLFYRTGTFAKKSVLAGIFLLSYLTWGFAVERGNLALYSMVFLMFSLALRNSKDKALREASLVFLALSAGLKLYPALFGFLWIVERRYQEALRLLAYGLAAFFVPFFFVDSFGNYLSTFRQYLDKGMYSHASVWKLAEDLSGGSGHTQLIGRGMVAAILLWALLVLFLDGVNWKTITILMATQTAILPEQYIYAYVFLMIPLVCFLNEAGQRKLDVIYAALFAALFAMPPLVGGRGRLPVWIWTGILFLVSADELIFLLRKRKAACSAQETGGRKSH